MADGRLMLLLLLLLAASSGTSSAASSPSSAPAPGRRRRRWAWPMPRLRDGRAPQISDGFGPNKRRNADGTPRAHAGVDVMYRRLVTLPKGTKLPLPDHGSRGYEVPEETPVLAASDGVIWSTGTSKRGRSIVIAHGPDTKLATFYQHLDSIVIPEHRRGRLLAGGPGLRVEAGQVIGTVGYSELDAAEVRHLHFELREGTRSLDPETAMRSWEIIDG